MQDKSKSSNNQTPDFQEIEENKDIFFEYNNERFELKKILLEKYNGLVCVNQHDFFGINFFDSIRLEGANHISLIEVFNIISEKSSKKHFILSYYKTKQLRQFNNLISKTSVLIRLLFLNA